MKNLQNQVHYKENYIKYINNKFKKKIYYSKIISKKILNIIPNTESVLIITVGENRIIENIICKKKIIIDPTIVDKKTNENKINLSEIETIIITDFQYLENPNKLISFLYNNTNTKIRLILVNYESYILTFGKLFYFLNFNKFKNNFLSSKTSKKLLNNYNFDLIRVEKFSLTPIKNLFILNLYNLFSNLILKYFNPNFISVYKKKYSNTSNIKKQKISVIIPCKNEEGNIKHIFNDLINLGKNTEILFGDDKSTDNTVQEINKYIPKDNISVKKYDAPGIGKSENVYKGLDLASGDIVCIYDADRTVKFSDLELLINTLLTTNSDLINCSRMIIKQEKNAMPLSNYFGNIFFAKFFSLIFNQKITDTLCGTKIFYKKDWEKIKKTNSSWGKRDLWGDFDILLGGYINNLKIIEIPIKYYERTQGLTKMNSVINNGLIMINICLNALYKLKIK